MKQASYIAVVAEEGSITGAAKKLHISQPSLSQTLKLVEEELGIPLFDRTGKKLSLTQAGQKYLRSMREIMDVENNLRHELDTLKEEGRSTLRIGISAQRSIFLLPDLLPRFIEKHPHVTIELKELPSIQLEEFLLKGACDVAFITTFPKENGLTYRLVENEQIVLMASKKTSLAKRVPSGTPIELDEAREEQFVMLSGGHSVRSIQDRLCELRQIHPKIRLELTNMEAAKLILLQLNAVMISPYGYLQGDSRVEQLASCYPLNCHGIERHFYFCAGKSVSMNSTVTDLYDIACNVCRSHTLNLKKQ